MVLCEAFEDVRLSGEDDAGDAAVDEEAHHLRRWLRLHAPPLRAALLAALLAVAAFERAAERIDAIERPAMLPPAPGLPEVSSASRSSSKACHDGSSSAGPSSTSSHPQLNPPPLPPAGAGAPWTSAARSLGARSYPAGRPTT